MPLVFLLPLSLFFFRIRGHCMIYHHKVLSLEGLKKWILLHSSLNDITFLQFPDKMHKKEVVIVTWESKNFSVKCWTYEPTKLGCINQKATRSITSFAFLFNLSSLDNLIVLWDLVSLCKHQCIYVIVTVSKIVPVDHYPNEALYRHHLKVMCIVFHVGYVLINLFVLLTNHPLIFTFFTS